MPYLNIKLCAPPSPEMSNKAAAAVTELTAEILKKTRKLSAVAVEYVADGVVHRWLLAAYPTVYATV